MESKPIDITPTPSVMYDKAASSQADTRHQHAPTDLSEPGNSFSQELGTPNSSTHSKRKRKIGGDAPKSISPRPNCFYSVQIKDKDLHTNMAAVHKTLVSYNDAYEAHLVKLATLHITLAVVRLKGQEEIDRACLALEDLVSLARINLSHPITIDFAGITTFKDRSTSRVVFAELVHNQGQESLNQLASLCREQIEQHNVCLTDERPFHPHLTVMKINEHAKPKLRKIDPESYAVHLQDSLGSQTVSSVQLCSMEMPKDPKTGYYTVFKEIAFSETPDGQK